MIAVGVEYGLAEIETEIARVTPIGVTQKFLPGVEERRSKEALEGNLPAILRRMEGHSSLISSIDMFIHSCSSIP
ncbi:unnamed protein product [Cercopithifilaria johnstoni]|uniref:Uncharacterized protein n=1 Tax=Cercopithifilaria johnstoni TaxID=2874296 RepID=A0A8J2Q706_9BILA|nr:unnamed protein product [Cercopithifilaria johnstoni]